MPDMKVPVVSVLIPAYNRERFLPEALQSMAEQTFPDLEILVYDDGSTDGTREVARRFAGVDGRVRLLAGDVNRGVSFARNALLDAASCGIACWQDSDDVSNVHRVARQLAVLKDRRVDAVHSQLLPFRGALDPAIWRSAPLESRRNPSWSFATTMFRMDKGIRFRLSLRWGEDGPWKGDYRRAHGGIVKLDSQLYYCRVHPDRLGEQKRRRV